MFYQNDYRVPLGNYRFNRGKCLLARGQAPTACCTSERCTGSGSRSLQESRTGSSFLVLLRPSDAELSSAALSHAGRQKYLAPRLPPAFSGLAALAEAGGLTAHPQGRVWLPPGSSKGRRGQAVHRGLLTETLLRCVSVWVAAHPGTSLFQKWEGF